MSTLISAAIDRLKEETGQAIILFIFIVTVIFIVGAIAVDFGIWLSERRGAQTDSDLISLAGAYELLDSTAGFAEVDAATQDSSVANGIDPVGDLQNLQVRSLEFPAGYENGSEYCHTAPDTGGRLNAVVLDVEHDSNAFFAGIFGIAAPDIGAHACARAGSLRSTSGLKPWSVPRVTSDCFEWDGAAYVPQFGETCIFRIDNPSQVGAIRLGDEEGDPCTGPGSGGAQVYRENIVEGSPAWCEIGEDIDTEPGLEPNPTKTALAELLSLEGGGDPQYQCDPLNGWPAPDGIDDFGESFISAAGEPPAGPLPPPGPNTTFFARGCETPRALSIVIIDEFDGTGFDSVPILGFASFFLEGCEVLDNAGTFLWFSRDCDFSGPFFNIRGFFMQLLQLEGDIGAFDEFGTKVIRLAE